MVSRSNPLANAVKAETGRADFREHLSVSLFALSRSFSLSVSSRFTDRSYYYIIITIITTTTVESGASRNYEPWKGEETANELKERERQEAEEGDEMKKLENKTKASKREMDLNAALDEMKSLSARHARMDFDGVVANVAKMGEREREKREMEEEMRAKKMYEMAVRESKAREEKKQQQKQRERGEDASTNTNNDTKSADDKGEHKKLEDIYSEDEEEKEARDAEEARLRRRKIIEDVGEEHGTKKTFEKETTKTKKKLAIQRVVATSADANVEKEEPKAPVVPPSALLAQHYSSSSE